MITLYKPTETDFTHNGIGILDDNIYDAVIEEELNGLYVLSFKYPLFAPHGLEIDGQYLIKAPTPDGDQLFRVANHAPSMGELNVFCYHVFYDLVDNLIEDTFIQDKNGQSALQQISERLQYKTKFTFSCDISKVASSRLVQKNPVEAILDSNQENSFVSRWGGELKRDNFNVNMMQQRGKDRGVVIQHKKDLLGYEADVDWQSPITKIMPKGFDGLLLPEKYINSYFIRNYINPKIRVVEFEHIKAAIGDYVDDEDAVPLEEAYKMLRDAAQAMYDVQKVDQPKATYKVELQELSQTEEYKDFAVLQRVYMGDTVTVEHKEDNINVQAKVISYKYDPIKNEYIEITLGNFKESFTNAFGKLDQIQDEINKVSEMPNSILNAAKENATKLINSGFGGNVRIYPERILIMDTKDEMTAKKVWQWNINGFGYSSTGINGPYNTAITMDGRIVADFITTGTLSGNLIRGGLITGTTLRTDNSSNYVSIDKQFIRLMESNLTRMFLGYYWNKDGRMQPTILLHDNVNTSQFNDGTFAISQQNTGNYYVASMGIVNGKTSTGDPKYPSKINLFSDGDALLQGDNNVTINAGKELLQYANGGRFYVNAEGITQYANGGPVWMDSNNTVTVRGSGISHYAKNGSFYVEATGGAVLKGGSKNVVLDTKGAIVFSLNDKNMLDVVDNNGETDLRFQTVLLRNGSVPGYAGKLQVKSGSGTSYSPVVASNFETSSQRKYKTNIRDVQFSALEKIMALNIQQYNLKTDMEQLYEMRMNRQEDEIALTTKDITTRYGWIADDENNPECFVTKERNAAEIYSSLAIQIRAFQEEKIVKDKEIDDLKTKIKAFEERLALLEQRLS